MKISIITLFPDLYDPFLKTSLVRRASERGNIAIQVQNIFNYCKQKERIDSPTFGHGAGLLIRPDVVEKAIENQEVQCGKAYKIFFSPQGKKLNQEFLRCIAQKVSQIGHVMLLPARYEGMDARIEEHYADCIVSLGDFVLMGGDLPAMVLIEGLLRLVPGVVGNYSSVEQDSFAGAFVDYRQFTAPVEWKGYKVPDVIRSGNHKKIQEWQEEDAIKRSVIYHFEWVRSHVQTKDEIANSLRYIPAHYVVLMHSQILLEGEREGTSSVTSLDIHDIARSAKTFGIKKYFIVTPLADQKKIVQKLLNFWQTDVGIAYNSNRHEAVSNIVLVDNICEVMAYIEDLEKKTPLLIATAARKQMQAINISYNDQQKVWSLGRPVLLVFGTARGLAPSIINRCDFVLNPIRGFSTFNHLSVRSAAAIVFDRWLGIATSSFHTC